MVYCNPWERSQKAPKKVFRARRRMTREDFSDEKKLLGILKKAIGGEVLVRRFTARNHEKNDYALKIPLELCPYYLLAFGGQNMAVSFKYGGAGVFRAIRHIRFVMDDESVEKTGRAIIKAIAESFFPATNRGEACVGRDCKFSFWVGGKNNSSVRNIFSEYDFLKEVFTKQGGVSFGLKTGAKK